MCFAFRRWGCGVFAVAKRRRPGSCSVLAGSSQAVRRTGFRHSNCCARKVRPMLTAAVSRLAVIHEIAEPRPTCSDHERFMRPRAVAVHWSGKYLRRWLGSSPASQKTPAQLLKPKTAPIEFPDRKRGGGQGGIGWSFVACCGGWLPDNGLAWRAGTRVRRRRPVAVQQN